MPTPERIWYIYALVDPRTDEVRYVGWSFNVPRRVADHIKCAKKERSHKASWLKQLALFGMEPLYLILEYGRGHGNWNEPERRWIAAFRMTGAPLTNLTAGGDGMPGYKWTEAQKEKLRNRKLTEERKRRIALAKMGNTPSEETRRKISVARKGFKLSEEHHRKLIAAHTGIPLTEAHKQKISNAHKGRSFSEETRRKMAEAQKRIKHGPLSETHRRNLSLSKTGKPQLCGICKSPDHNRRTCPNRSTPHVAEEPC